MRYKDINGLTHDLMEVVDWTNPLNNFSIPKEVKIDLISGELNVSDEDDVTEILKEKREWFLERIMNLNGKLEGFSEARIVASKSKQKIILVYKGKKFEREKNYN